MKTFGVSSTVPIRGLCAALCALVVIAAHSTTAVARLDDDATQAVLYNGSSAASSVSVVAYTDAGFLIEVASVLFQLCAPAEPSDAPKRLQAATPAAAGVYRAGFGIHGADPARWPKVTFHWPHFVPSSVGDDCDALDQVDAIQVYLSQVSSTADARHAAIAACAAEVEQLACQLDLVASAVSTVPPPDPPNPCALIAPTLPLGYGSPPLCQTCVSALSNVASALDQLMTKRAECELMRTDLANALDQFSTALAASQPVREDLRDCALILGPHHVDVALGALAQANAFVSDIATQGLACSLAHLEANCPCDGVPPLRSAGPRSTTIVQHNSRSAIDRLTRAFAAAARRASDPEERRRLLLLALRLDHLPGRRIVEVTVPAAGQLAQDLVALRSPCAPEDRNAPLAVVLALRPVGRETPVVSAEEQRRLFDAFKLFASTLEDERSCPSLHSTGH